MAIRLQGVSKRYYLGTPVGDGLKHLLLHLPSQIKAIRQRKPFDALVDISFDVHRGECLSLIGRNGAGKSTTLGMIAGVLKPSAGTLETHGRISPLLELGAGFNQQLTGRENIMLNGVMLGLTRREVRERTAEIIAFSELEDFIDAPLRTYSSGMIVRLGFSVAVHLDPDILLVDEVLAVGDARFRQKCLERMKQFRSRGTTMVFVSHDVGTVAKISDRVAFLESGRLVEIGDPAKAIEAYQGRLRAA
ncbi:MAG: ABC transporter ATP-binding protein [Planctomycetota bacterium]|nr:MAG: ABC transporter ATP-binding protein [Planctomycetota bacterium]